MQFSKRMQNLSESVFTKLDREKDAMLKKGRKIYDFRIGKRKVICILYMIQKN